MQKRQKLPGGNPFLTIIESIPNIINDATGKNGPTPPGWHGAGVRPSATGPNRRPGGA